MPEYDEMEATGASAFELFNSIVGGNDDDGDNVCMISGQQLDNTKTTLPCAHSFNYIPLLNDLISYSVTHGRRNHIQCPYCRTLTYATIPYRPDIVSTRKVSVNLPVASCFSKHDCMVTECTINATVPIGDSFACYKHFRKQLKLHNDVGTTSGSQSKCPAILKSGANKGKVCGAKTKTGFCKRHTPKP